MDDLLSNEDWDSFWRHLHARFRGAQESNLSWEYDPHWHVKEVTQALFEEIARKEATQAQFEEIARTDESGWQGHNWQRDDWQEPGWQDKEVVQDQHVESATPSVHQRIGLRFAKAKTGVAGSGKGQEAAQDQHEMSSSSSVRQRLGLLTVKVKAGVAGSESDH